MGQIPAHFHGAWIREISDMVNFVLEKKKERERERQTENNMMGLVNVTLDKTIFFSFTAFK